MIRYGKIDEENGTITLNLPVGTDLTAISPTITHTGTHTNMDSGTFDFSGGKTQTLTVYNRTYELERSYTVTITAEASSQNAIESYSIGDAIGTINADTGVVEITIPYATDLASVQPKIVISEFATRKSVPDRLSEGDNEYVVAMRTASSGRGLSRSHALLPQRATIFCPSAMARCRALSTTIRARSPWNCPREQRPPSHL